MQVFDDIAVELAMAILQFFQSDPVEEQVFRTLKALGRFLEVSIIYYYFIVFFWLTLLTLIFKVSADVAAIIQMIGPHPKQFAGMSERVDELVNNISRKVPA